ncbi:MAG: hemerythrin domain-containing protein [Chitinispirillaceae bacterium]
MSKFIDDLRDEHVRIRDFFSKLEALSSIRDWENRELMYAKLKDVMLPHFQAEEEVLFPQVISSGEMKEKILYYSEQHSIIKRFNDELSDRSKQAHSWQAGINVLREMVEMHLDKEEADYPAMMESIDPQKAGEVYEKFLQVEVRFRKQMRDLKTKPY